MCVYVCVEKGGERAGRERKGGEGGGQIGWSMLPVRHLAVPPCKIGHCLTSSLDVFADFVAEFTWIL